MNDFILVLKLSIGSITANEEFCFPKTPTKDNEQPFKNVFTDPFNFSSYLIFFKIPLCDDNHFQLKHLRQVVRKLYILTADLSNLLPQWHFNSNNYIF